MKRRSTREPKTKRRYYGGGYPPFKPSAGERRKERCLGIAELELRHSWKRRFFCLPQGAS